MVRIDLGALYAEGRGVRRNLKKARDLLTIEVKRRNPSAIRNLAITEKNDQRLVAPSLQACEDHRHEPPDLNGQVGMVQSYDEAKGRCVVRLTRRHNTSEEVIN